MLRINEKLRILRLDNNNLVLEELRIVESEKKGKREKWMHCGYYGSLKATLVSALEKTIFDSVEKEVEIKDLINIIDNAKQEIITSFLAHKDIDVEEDKDFYKHMVDFVNKNNQYTQEYGDVIHSMALIRELDKLMGKEKPNQAKGE